MISSGGWTMQLYTPQPTSKKNDDKKKKEKKAVTPEDIVCDLLPVPIVVDEYYEISDNQRQRMRLARYGEELVYRVIKP